VYVCLVGGSGPQRSRDRLTQQRDLRWHDGDEHDQRQAPGETAVRILPDHSHYDSPCGLPGGHVASLWLERPWSRGLHELEIAAPDGIEFSVLTPDVDVLDVGMSCHQ